MLKLTGLAYRLILKPLMFKFSTPDGAHEKMIRFGAWAGRHSFMMGLLKFTTKFKHTSLRTLAFFQSLDSPIGFAAGIDKNAEITRCIEAVGFNYATFGSMTAEICPGNHKPWFHRLPKYKSMMVHVGLANNGIEANLENLTRAYDEAQTIIPGVSIARTNLPHSSTSLSAGIKDFQKSFKLLKGRVGLIEVNISCPNAYCGEQFSQPEALEKLLTALDKISRDAPVVLKMPSDQAWPEFKQLIDVALQHNVQGITICNLRKDRTDMDIPADWKGNLSGKPVQNLSDDLIAKSYRYLQGRLVIIGLGGVFNAQDAYRKIRLGANLVEIASALMYEGPQVVTEVKRGLVKLLKRDGFSSIMQVVGIDS
jgi:dihydroorotate dehydrogenase (fumarate)